MPEVLPVSDSLCDTPTARPKRSRCCKNREPWREQGRACLTSIRSALLVSASVGALALPILAGCTTVSPRTAAEAQETAQSGRAGQEAGKLSQQEVQSSIQNLLQGSLPSLVEQFGLEQGLAEFRSRIHVVLEAMALAGGHASDTYWAYWSEYWKAEYERVANLARQRNAEAQYTLAMYYGLGTSSDHIKAAEWLHKSAEEGYRQAQLVLGHESYVRQNYADAVKWYRLAAEQGDAVAQNQLGDMYYHGEGLSQDYAEAARWYRRAAQQGSGLSSRWAQYILGSMYAEGKGVPQDDAKAVKWWRLAAGQGDASAQHNLGIMYANGRGVPGDHAEALRWFRKAADQGVAEAQLNLARLYAGGEGVPQDHVQAYMWGSLAVAGLPPGDRRDLTAEGLDNYAAGMTPEGIAEAQRMAREWLERHRTAGEQ